MVRRVVEEDVSTPTTTVVEDDGSWLARTVVMLVVLALVVAGAIWLVRVVSNDTSTNGPRNQPGNVVPSAQIS